MKGYMYILKCADGSYYVGSTKYLELRVAQHQSGQGANHTKKRLPVELVYYEEYARIDHAFYREKQVQGWRREKKEALINGEHHKLPELAKAYGKKLPSPPLPSTSSGSTLTSSGSASIGSDCTLTGSGSDIENSGDDTMNSLSTGSGSDSAGSSDN